MIFSQEKRLLLGWLALLVPLPLPLNDVLEWPTLFAYTFFVIFFIQRSERGLERPLPNWALNVLGLVYLPVLLVDMRLGLMRDQVVKALLHLILFLVVVKLFSIRREKDKWHVFVSIFFLFVAAMATSSHLTIAFYLLAVLAVGFYVMARFAHLHVLGSLGQEPTRPAPFPPVRWSMVLATLLIVAVSVPIFASLPRLRQPFIMGRGSGNIGLARTTGFSDAVDLSLTSEIRGNRAVALRVQFSRPTDAEGMRFKGASYDFYRNRKWYRHPLELQPLKPDDEGTFRLPGQEGVEPRLVATLFREPLDSDSLVLPVEAVGFDLQSSLARLRIDPGGAVSLPSGQGRQNLRYEVLLGAKPVIAAYSRGDASSRLGEDDLPFDALDEGGITDRMRALAVEVMGPPIDNAGVDSAVAGNVGVDSAVAGNPSDDSSAVDEAGADELSGLAPDARVREAPGPAPPNGSEASQKVDLLLAHLLESYTYTTNFVGRDGQTPIESFLFEHKSGHCEYFATSMVLLLRSQEIPARLVTGFLGAEFNPIEDYFIVRQQNAHAWVEAYTEDRGWAIYDPTPPDGRPSIAVGDWKLLAQQLYDYVAFRWDRYVLSYGSADQESFFRKTRDRIAAFWSKFWQSDEPAPPDPRLAGDPGAEDLVATVSDGPAIWQTQGSRWGLAILLVLGGGTLVVWRLWPMQPERAYGELRQGITALDLPVDSTIAPLELRDLLLREFPAGEEAFRLLIDTYVASSFAGRSVPSTTQRRLRPALSQALKLARRETRQRRKGRRSIWKRGQAPTSG